MKVLFVCNNAYNPGNGLSVSIHNTLRTLREHGVDVLYDDMAADNPAIGLFLSEGFQLVEERPLTRLLKKDLTR